MSHTTYDVLVTGGGPVGWACALAARRALGAVARVGVVERDALPSGERFAGDAPLSARVYTVAQGNLDWLAQGGAVPDAGRCATVTAIRVLGHDGVENMQIDAAGSGHDALAAVIEHEALTLAIADAARAQGVAALHGEGVDLHDSDGDQGCKLLELADRSLLAARLVIVADGAGSQLRAVAGIAARRSAYPQHGVVANLIAARAHAGVATQWFLADGSILALLPLPDIQGAPAHSMVWSTTPSHAAALTAMTDDELVRAVNAASAGACRVQRVAGGARSFPLTLLRAADPVAPRVLAVGDAAHAMHPLAGQGVNVGLADARALHAVWQSSVQAQSLAAADPGHPLLLGRYRRQRYAPTLAMQLVTDGLFRLYNQAGPLRWPAAGDAGMRLFGRLPAFRRTLSSAAAQ